MRLIVNIETNPAREVKTDLYLRDKMPMGMGTRYVLLLAGIAIIHTFLFAPAAAAKNGMDASERRIADELVRAANEDRAPRHMQTLHPNADLMRAAWFHAQRLVRAGTLSHQLPGEPTLIMRVQQAGVHFSTVAENLAEGSTAAEINNGWMHSPPHRANLLDPRLNAVGIAVIKSHGRLYAVQDFARLVTAMSGTQEEQQVASLLTAHKLLVQGNPAIARSYCGNSTGHTQPMPKLVMHYTTATLTRLPAQARKWVTSHRYHRAIVGACPASHKGGFTTYQIVILFY